MKSELLKKIISAVKSAEYNPPSDFSVTEAPKPEIGDFATNVAMIIAGQIKDNPREIANKIKIELEKYDDIIKVEVAGPGFINIKLELQVYFDELAKIVEQKEQYGRSEIGAGKKINVEYVSANPTGPLHIGNARSGPIGEAIANLFMFLGYDTTKEFYINDIGVQIGRFGQSLYHWYEIKDNVDVKFPEEGYPGPYIKETSEVIQLKFDDEISKISDREELIKFFAKVGLDIMVEKIRDDLKFAGMKIDVWSYESKIAEAGKSAAVIERLRESGNTIEKEGAVWFKQPDDPELADKEAVLVKSDENHSVTYFANDLAYHLDKIERGATKMIDVWGANHFGHIPRMRAALKALGQPDALEIVLYQYVRLKKSGQAASMGKRLGNFISLREVIEAGVVPDAFKYFILSQNPNTPFDFDLELAADTSEKNPVFYIKYAHARICSILEKSRGEGTGDGTPADYSVLNNAKEIALIKELIKFPELIEEISTNFQIQALPHFAYKIAGLFHDFYGSCRVIGAETKQLKQARLFLIRATKYVLKNALNILSIDAPEKM
ncbi:arginine--tRNA ligase [Candidatus Berkelbacteria bacterium CG10_big_fil_rev_8_21_14_0_10_43_13]|uniref:Arginine--tRNA ligase n=1 Tax=Candidatus Berkelbacteria bacterium CG10_big_fil_rev_8_21_14_0_10_43_13 TaxID=1974514 RepID=A0A2H0W709_9BACT|nr:MAG: arginine--tRNA ligase [Candidatus Berkelbacteria bacterium CG10_big_fil_rev_8_21_14_0_10_43_13]